MSDQDFLDTYWTGNSRVWSAFFKGQIGIDQRESLLRPMRQRLHRIQVERDRADASRFLANMRQSVT